MLQETLTEMVSLSGYTPHITKSPDGRGICTLVSNQYTSITHNLHMRHSKVEHSLIEIIPGSKLRNSIFILHIYSSPKGRHHRFTTLLSKAITIASNAGAPIVIAGDFNAPHHAWGYPRTIAKGAELWQAASDLHLTLVTDPAFPTRTGNSCSRDTTPDLTFVATTGEVSWSNLAEDLGSDHYILSTTLQIQGKPPRNFKFTDWDLFRKIRSRNTQEGNDPPDFSKWLSQLGEDVKSATKTIKTDLKVSKMDSRLAHLLEAKSALVTRWKAHRLNRRLRKRIASLNRDISVHCQTLEKQHWDEICNTVDGQMRVGGKWNLLKHLLQETKSRSTQTRLVDRILHSEKKSEIRRGNN